MRRSISLLLSLCIAANGFAQMQTTPGVFSPVATKPSREKQYKRMMDTTIRQNLSIPLTDTTEGEWNEAFWAIELLMHHSDFCAQKLREAWNKINSTSEYFQKNLIEVSYALYSKEFKKQATVFLDSTTSIPVFIRCAEYLLQADPSATTRTIIQSHIQTKFSDTDHIGLTILQSRLSSINQTKTLPPLKDIFNKNFLNNQTVIYSLQRKNRDYPGMVVIRNADGSFVKDKNGNLFHVSQLARAITNYPFYITNGNTPQGIFRWTGFEISKLLFIGPTPNIQMIMPFEARPSTFFNDMGLSNAEWNKDMYASLLPSSWKNYDGIYESFYAGKMGRSAIIMHGTTVDPSYYKGQPFYPQTPSLGCLCSYEEWNSAGMRVNSSLQQIDDALDDIGATNGYVVVIELNDEKKPVTISDVSQLISSVESGHQ